MTDWLFDTLLWTAALIALVLVLRRPVARMFGPQFAYALWALPMLRLIMPPITLPAWLKPDLAANAALTNLPAQTSDAPVATHTLASAVSSENGAAATDLATPITPPSGLEALIEAAPLVEIGGAVWLIGAAIFMWHRFGSYFELRGELLADAREVGREGKIRLMETPGTKAPLAFGVVDPVIAMPDGFMAQTDKTARDLALAHELAHHKGRDLLINVAVQPLFALHWWNPLGRYGWLALRRDQEAACDARVMADQPTEDRATYANLITSFAAGPNVALAAPMACPVLGDKSIIHRLRSLNMTETSNRRRMAGRFMIGAAIIALPLTASITYAESIVTAVPAVPAAPAAPNALSGSPAVPVPPAPPAPPAMLGATQIATIDPDSQSDVAAVKEGDKNVIVYRTMDESDDGKVKTKVKRLQIKTDGQRMSQEEKEALIAELRADLADVDIDIKNVVKEIEVAFLEMDEARGEQGRTIVKMKCLNDNEDVATVVKKDGEVRTVLICESKIMAHALKGLKEARKAIAENPEMVGEIRENVLKELDEQIENWNSDNG